jgi:hypothetical protein
VLRRTVAKKLPWLDGRNSQGVTITSPLRSGSDSSWYETPSPGTHPSSRKPSTTAAARPTPKPAPTARRKSLAKPTEHRVLFVAESSPSPVSRHHLSQARRASAVQKNLSPLKPPIVHRPSTSHEPQKRLSIVHHPTDEPEEDAYGDIRPRVGSLAPLPDHLERDSTSDSVRMPTQRDGLSNSSPAFLTQPVPICSVIRRAGDRVVGNAIEGLEDMVQEAVDIADKTRNQHEVEEIRDIIEDARNAIQEAAEDPAKYLMRTASPLVVSDSSRDTDGVSDFSSQSLYDRNRGGRISPKLRKAPPSAPVPIERNVLDFPLQAADPEVHPGLQHGPLTFDWAYSEPKSHSPRRCSTSSSTSSDHAERGTRIEPLLPPHPIQTTPRDHIDFVLRPMTRDHDRGRSPERATGDSALRVRKPRHRSTSRSRRQHPESSGYSQIDTSFDEEDRPVKIYGNQLAVPDQAYNHTFSLRRHHRRQPIARNWSTGKKRLTATIACVNTALLGIIVGIYVGGPEVLGSSTG